MGGYRRGRNGRRGGRGGGRFGRRSNGGGQSHGVGRNHTLSGPNQALGGSTFPFDNQHPRQGTWVWTYTPHFTNGPNSHEIFPSLNDHFPHTSGQQSQQSHSNTNQQHQFFLRTNIYLLNHKPILLKPNIRSPLLFCKCLIP